MLDWEDPRDVLRRYGLSAKKRYSQNFLIDRFLVEKIASLVKAQTLAAGINRVIEIGPGAGTLSGALLRTDLQVEVWEADRQMCDVLEQEFQGSLSLKFCDATKNSLSDLDVGALVGNLPYSVTGRFLRNLIEAKHPPPFATFMVQKEVADRLIAPPAHPDYSKMTVLIQNRFETTLELHVPAESFHPAPRVQSAVVSLKRREPIVPADQGFSSLLRQSFSQRRKTLANNLRPQFGKAVVETALSSMNIDARARAETLSVQDFRRLQSLLQGSDNYDRIVTEEP